MGQTPMGACYGLPVAEDTPIMATKDAELPADDRRAWKQHQQYRPDIDGLRCVCVLMVVVYHLSNGTMLQGGLTGVDIFFVISGYVVTGSLLHDRDGSPLGELLLRFYARRCKRLTPTLVTVVVCAALVFCMFRDTTKVLLLDEYFQTGMFGLAGCGNMYLALKGVSYFDDGAGSLSNPFLHLWSLGVEEQFYLLWPFGLCALVHGCSDMVGASERWPILAVFVVGSAAAGAALEFGLRWDDELLFYSLPARAWQLLGGALTFFLTAAVQASDAWQAALGRLQPWLQLPTLALLVATALVSLPTRAGVLARGLLPVAAGICFIVAGTTLPSSAAQPVETDAKERKSNLCRYANLNELLGLAVPRYVGRISYPLYLWHWPTIVIGKACFGLPPDAPLALWPSIVVLATSILLASLTYHTVEAVARKWRPKYSLAIILAAVLSVVLGEGVLALLDGPLGPHLYVGPRHRPEEIFSLPIQPETCKGSPKSMRYSASLPPQFLNTSGRCTDPPAPLMFVGGDTGDGCEVIDLDYKTTVTAVLDPNTISRCLAPLQVDAPAGWSPERPRVMLLGDSHANHMVPAVYNSTCQNYDFGHLGCVYCNWEREIPILVDVIGPLLRAGDMLLLSLHLLNMGPEAVATVVKALAPLAVKKNASLVILGDHMDWKGVDLSSGSCEPLISREPCSMNMSVVTSQMPEWDTQMQGLVDEYSPHVYHFSYWKRFCSGDPNVDSDSRCGTSQCFPFVPNSGLAFLDQHHFSQAGSLYVGRQLHEFLATCSLVPASDTAPPAPQAHRVRTVVPAVNNGSPSRATVHGLALQPGA